MFLILQVPRWERFFPLYPLDVLGDEDYFLPSPRIHVEYIAESLRVSIYVGQTRDYLNGFQPFGRYNFFNILTRIGRERRPAKRPPTEGWQTSTSSPQNSFIRERRGTSDLEETAPFRMHNTF